MAIISEYTGITSRSDPGSWLVHASVARTTTSAVTVPWSVTTLGRAPWPPGMMADAEVPSTIVTPRASTAVARPTARRAGWMAAQWGVKVAPSTEVAPTRADASAAPIQRSSSGPNPSERASATSAAARLAWAAERASMRVPPLARWQSIPSCVAAEAISSMDAFMAARIARAASIPTSRAIRPSWAAKRAEAQPPLRPEAPKPQTSRSMISTRSVGSAAISDRAVHRPV